MASRKFMAAAARGDLELAKSLLTKENIGELLDSAGDDGNTALIHACSNGREKVVRHLLGKGAKLETCNNYGWTSLMAASYYGHYSIVATLLQHNCNPNYVSKLYCSPLRCAARCNHIQAAELLIEKGAEVDDLGGSSFRTPLMTAVQHGHDSMVELLISRGANVNYKDPQTGWTPLMLAALNGHTTAAEILIKSGANCNELNNLGQSALEIAKSRRRKDVENVLDRVTTIGVRNSGSRTVDINIIEAATQGNLEQIKELSKKMDFNVNETNQDGVTPLMCAAAGNHFKVCQFLLEQNADINLRQKSCGWTALMHAINNCHQSIICLLILSGADVQLRSFSGHTAFDIATMSGQPKIIEILAAGVGMCSSSSKRTYLQKVLKEALSNERNPFTIKYIANEIQVLDMDDTNRQGIKVLVSRGLKKLWNINRTVRGMSKNQPSKPRSFQPILNDLSSRCQISVHSVKDSNVLSGNNSSADQLSTVVLGSVNMDGIERKKSAHLPLAGPSTNLWNNELSNAVVPPFTPSTTLDFETKRRKSSSDTLSVSPQDSGFYSVQSNINERVSPVSPNSFNQGEQSPESSFSFSSANSPNSSFTGSTNTRGFPPRKQGLSPVNFPQQFYKNVKQRGPNSLVSCSPPSTLSTSSTQHYLVPKTNKFITKRKCGSLPRIGQSSVSPIHNRHGSVRSEPDAEEMKHLLAKLSLEKYTPIFEEHEVDKESFLTLNEADLDEIGINQDDAKEQILSAVCQLRKRKERNYAFLQTEAWS